MQENFQNFTRSIKLKCSIYGLAARILLLRLKLSYAA
jgi:hypothetical protein